jgi:hypothetical protein
VTTATRFFIVTCMWFCLCVEPKPVARKSFDRRKEGTGRETLRPFQHSKFHFIDDPIVAAHHRSVNFSGTRSRNSRRD